MQFRGRFLIATIVKPEMESLLSALSSSCLEDRCQQSSGYKHCSYHSSSNWSRGCSSVEKAEIVRRRKARARAVEIASGRYIV